VISKEAILYDLREVRSRLATKHTREARSRIDEIRENGDTLLGSDLAAGRQPQTTVPGPSAERFGREAILALQGHCRRAIMAIDDGDFQLADKIIVAAQSAWEKVPDAPKVY
jgi:hypothetical protein